jgi:hypothetical protein
MDESDASAVRLAGDLLSATDPEGAAGELLDWVACANVRQESDDEWERRKPRAWAPTRFRDRHVVGCVYPPEESYSADYHDQVVVIAWEGTPIGVDLGIAPLLVELWRRGYRTYVSCEGDSAEDEAALAGDRGDPCRELHWAFIDFETPDMAREFINDFRVSEFCVEHALVRFPASILHALLSKDGLAHLSGFPCAVATRPR